MAWLKRSYSHIIKNGPSSFFIKEEVPFIGHQHIVNYFNKLKEMEANKKRFAYAMKLSKKQSF